MGTKSPYLSEETLRSTLFHKSAALLQVCKTPEEVLDIVVAIFKSVKGHQVASLLVIQSEYRNP